MQLHLLGTGSPNPLPHRQGSATLISHDDEHILVDAGRGVTTQLVRAGVAPQELSAIFITHHHYDHIGALADLLLTAWHGGASHLPLYGPSGAIQIVHTLFDHVYHRELTFSHALARATGTTLPDFRAVVQVAEIDPARSYTLRDWHINAAVVDHGQRLGLTYEEWPCLAYRFERDNKSIVISGDTVACHSLIALAQDADVLVQCCFLADADLTTPARR
ncbi:MAG: MBL fold metallo-hydrolase, partial [Chloroflexota bacterium]